MSSGSEHMSDCEYSDDSEFTVGSSCCDSDESFEKFNCIEKHHTRCEQLYQIICTGCIRKTSMHFRMGLFFDYRGTNARREEVVKENPKNNLPKPPRQVARESPDPQIFEEVLSFYHEYSSSAIIDSMIRDLSSPSPDQIQRNFENVFDNIFYKNYCADFSLSEVRPEENSVPVEPVAKPIVQQPDPVQIIKEYQIEVGVGDFNQNEASHSEIDYYRSGMTPTHERKILRVI